MNTSTDETLMQQLQQGDTQAYATLVDRYLNKIVWFAERHLGCRSEAEDAAQETFLRLWRHAARWQIGRCQFSTWLHTITYNLCVDTHRTRRKDHESLDEDIHASIEAETISPLKALAGQKLADKVNQALQGLSEHQRSALVLCHYQHLSNQEAADIMGISVHALESLLVRARRALRQLLSDDITSCQENLL